MERAALIILELEVRRTQALFRRGRTWMGLMLGGSALAIAGLAARAALGL